MNLRMTQKPIEIHLGESCIEVQQSKPRCDCAELVAAGSRLRALPTRAGWYSAAAAAAAAAAWNAKMCGR